MATTIKTQNPKLKIIKRGELKNFEYQQISFFFSFFILTEKVERAGYNMN